MLLLLLVLASVLCCYASACSNFLLSNDFVISGRTMDLGVGLSFGVATIPRGSNLTNPNRKSRHGFVGFIPVLGFPLDHIVTAGLNEAGLSCDQQTLLGTVYPNASGNPQTDIGIDAFCEYVLATFDNTTQLAAAIASKSITVHGPSIAGKQHFVVRDALGASLVIEFLEGLTQVFADNNDGKTGFGILTNEPPFEWQVENTKHAKWKLSNARSSFTIPGAFYPDERFLRIHLIKEGLPTPSTYAESIQQAVHVLNSVTVPPGKQMGTDSSKGEGKSDHTMFGVVYDHKQAIVYWRTESNQNLQRLRLVDAHLSLGSPPGSLAFGYGKNELPFFNDAASAITRN
jgi:penicillin V acylase-like amidase (Ntn superfamily)